MFLPFGFALLFFLALLGEREGDFGLLREREADLELLRFLLRLFFLRLGLRERLSDRERRRERDRRLLGLRRRRPRLRLRRRLLDRELDLLRLRRARECDRREAWGPRLPGWRLARGSIPAQDTLILEPCSMLWSSALIASWPSSRFSNVMKQNTSRGDDRMWTKLTSPYFSKASWISLSVMPSGRPPTQMRLLSGSRGFPRGRGLGRLGGVRRRLLDREYERFFPRERERDLLRDLEPFFAPDGDRPFSFSEPPLASETSSFFASPPSVGGGEATIFIQL